MMEDNVFSFDEFQTYSWGNGLFDELQIKQSYKIYVALESGDAKELEKALTNEYINTYYRLTDRFN
jgi:hypothetical protein